MLLWFLPCLQQQRRGFRKARPDLNDALMQPQHYAPAPTNTITDDSSIHKKFHPRRIAKGCDIDGLLTYLATHRDVLGPDRVFKALRAALYNAIGYKAEPAWRIYSAMVDHRVTDRMGANHYGHLLNLLKYGSEPQTIDRMLTVLDHMRQHAIVNATHCSQLLFAMARHGDIDRACQLLETMRRENIKPLASHYTSLAIAARKSGIREAGEKAAALIMDAVKKDKIMIEDEACAIMVSVLSRAQQGDQDLSATIEFLEALESTVASQDNGNNVESKPSRYNAHVYTSLIAGLADKGDAVNAKRLYDEMRLHGIQPTNATRTALLEAYSRAGDFRKALSYLRRWSPVNSLDKPVCSMATAVLTNAIRQDRWDIAEKLATRWMKTMDKREIDDKFRAALMWVQVKQGLGKAREFFDEMYKENREYVNAVMVNHMVIESGNIQRRDKVHESYELHKQVDPTSDPNLRSQHYYVDALFKCRDVPAALSAFMSMRRQGVPDDITMAMVVRGLVMNDEDQLAWNVFQALKLNKRIPNLWAYTSMLKAYGKKHPSQRIPRELLDMWPELYAVLKGEEHTIPTATEPVPFHVSPSQACLFFRQMTGYRKPNQYTYTTLISCFAKTSFLRATEVYNAMLEDNVEPTVQTYGAMLQACAIFRQPRMALLIFQQMLDKNVTPNPITWRYLLKALLRGRSDKEDVDRVGEMARAAMQKMKRK